MGECQKLFQDRGKCNGSIFNVSIQHCPSLLSVAVISTLRKAYLGWKGLLHLSGYSPLWRGRGKGAQAASCKQALKQRPWGNTADWLTSSTLLGYLKCTTLLRDGTTHSGVGPPTSIISEENAPKDMPLYQSIMIKTIHHLELSQITLGCVRLTAEANHGKNHSGTTGRKIWGKEKIYNRKGEKWTFPILKYILVDRKI